MRKILITMLLLIPFGAFAQKLNGFWGLNFYNTTEQVKEKVRARSGKQPEEGSGPSIIGYKNCDFAGMKASYVQLMFHNDLLYGGDIIIQPGKSDLLDVYQQLVSSLTAKYKTPQWENCLYSHVTQGDIKDGRTNTVCAYWSFPSSNKKEGPSRIIASIENNVIKISYRDGRIYDQLVPKSDTYLALDY
jgi:hypothetical protein